MSIEIEKKYRLSADRCDSIAASLTELGAVFEGEDFEVNTIFGGAALPEGSVVRIRRTQDRSLLTFKRRVENQSDVKHQLEYESVVENVDAVESIVRELGLEPKIVYEKRRRTWRFRDVEVVLDELPFGLFMEIEGSITEIREAEMLLDLDDLETEHETYPRMTARLGRLVEGVMEARFTPDAS